MKKVLAVAVLSGALGFVPALAQEKKEMPMKHDMPMNHEGMQGGTSCCQMKEMQDKMTQMKGIMKSTDMKGMGQMMGNMSAMMGDMSGMMKQMSDRMKTGMKKTQ